MKETRIKILRPHDQPGHCQWYTEEERHVGRPQGLPPEAEQADEMLLMGLRLAEGVDLRRLTSLGGVKPDHLTVDELVQLGLLEAPASDRLKATPRGRFVLNELVLQLSSSFVAARETSRA